MRAGTNDGPLPGAEAGLQNERTSLAWFRTSLSFAGVGALLLRSSMGLDRPVPAALGALALALSGVTLITSRTRYTSTATSIRRAQPIPRPTGLFQVTAVVALTMPVTLLVLRLASL